MKNEKKKVNIYRRIYEKQNVVFLGGSAFLTALIFLTAVCIMGAGSTRAKRTAGQFLTDGGKMKVTQELLDYLAAMPEIKSATPLIELPASLKLNRYSWNGSILGVDFRSHEFDLLSESGITGGNAIQLVFGNKIAEEFIDEEGEKINESKVPVFLQKLKEQQIELRMDGEQPGEESDPAAGQGAAAAAPGTGNMAETAAPGTGSIAETAAPGTGSMAETAAPETGIMAETVGFLKAVGEESDRHIYMDLTKVRQILRSQGNDDTYHKLLIEVWHRKDAAKVQSALEKTGFTGVNPYKAEMSDLEGAEKQLRIYFCLSMLLLLFSGLYIKNLIWEGGENEVKHC